VDRSGTLWIGTDGAGLQQYDRAGERFFPLLHDPANPSSLSKNVVRSIYEDVQGQIWVGTHLGGANVLKKPRAAFGYFTHEANDPSSLSHPSVTSFLEDREGGVWVGMKGGWLDRFEPQTGTFVPHRVPSAALGGLPNHALHEDRRGRIWVGTYRGGLVRFDPQRGTFATYRHQPGDARSLGNDEVWAVTEDEAGALWLGTNVGVDRFDPERGTVTAHYETRNPDGLSYAGVRALLVDRQRNLWVGTFGGLYLLRHGSGSFVRYRHDESDSRSLSHDGALSLHEDRQGQLWVGTFGGGLNRLDPTTGAFTSYRGFPSNVIYGIQADASGRLWLSTNHGLSRFDPATGGIENFDLTNGLQSLQFEVCASLKTRDGRMLFGSVDGFYYFDPATIKPDTFAPGVVLTSLRVLGEPMKLPTAVSTLDEITLAHRDKVVSFEFAALEYNFPRRNRYAYVMEGFTDQWVQLGVKRDVTFTNLDPGRYVFHVKASNSDGIWNEASAATLRVIVRPPFWGTWWFRGLSAALVGLALLTAHRVRVHNLTADITQRMRAELALRQAEEKYRSIFENAVEGIFQSTPDGRFLTVNPAFARMLGYRSPEEMLAEITDIEGQVYVEPGHRREMLRLLDEQGIVHGYECELRRRDGSALWVSVNVRVVRDPAGNLLFREGTSEDISDRWRAQQAEAALRAALEKAAVEWELTFDAMEAPIVIVDAGGRIARLNRAARELAGYPTHRDAVGLAVADVGPGQPWQKASEVAALVGKTRSATQCQVRDGASGRTWDLTAGPSAGPGDDGRVIVVARDLTRMVELQDSLRRSETMSAMGSLVAGVAHEVRNPLFGISANLDAFEAKARAATGVGPLVTHIRGEVNRLTNLMQDLLDYGKPVQAVPSPGSIETVVGEAVDACASLAASRGVKVMTSFAPGLPTILMDRTRLVQVFQNLLQNAIQHSPVGSVVSVDARKEAGEGGPIVVLTVGDSGPGFVPQDLPRVFEPFFSRRSGGTGLGLAIVQRIIEEHGGTVAVGNRPEGGAVMTVRLSSVLTF